MAGFYPDAPAPRLAYDIDGTKVYSYSVTNATITELTQPQKTSINDENGLTSLINFGGQSTWVIWIFPEPINLVGYKLDSVAGYGSCYFEYSLDNSAGTRNGVDGVWSSIVSGNWINGYASTHSPAYRSGISTVSIGNVRALRLRIEPNYGGDAVMYGAHLYANRVSAQKFIFCDSGGTQLGPAYFDFGDVAQGSTATKTFYLENVSGATISGVNLSTSTLIDKTPTIASQHLFSTDNSTWTQTLSLGNISNGTRYGPIYFKRNTSATAALSLYTGRIKVSWT